MELKRGGLTGERRVVTALFCDMVGSTSIAETMDPEDWGELVAEAVHAMALVIDRFGGTVSEFGGDAVVAVFGAPVAHEDDPYRAARTGLEIVDAMRHLGAQHNLSLEVRVGINTGLVVVGDIDAGPSSIYSALGDTLNVAARLQTLAEPGSVVVSAATRRLLGTDAEVRDLGTAELKGRSVPVQIFTVEGIKDLGERHRGVPGLTSPTVGRDGELQRIARLLEPSSGAGGRALAILGEPGAGKSRLIEEAARRALSTDGHLLWAEGACVPFDEDLPYHLVAALVRSLAGVDPSAPNEVARKGLEDLSDRLRLEGRRDSLQRLIGVESSGSQDPQRNPAAEYAAAVGDLISALAKSGRPVVLVCEDMHWADPSSIEVLEELLGGIPALPVILMIAMRPDRDSAGWELLEVARRDLAQELLEIELLPLDPAAARDLVGHLLEIESLPVNLRNLVLDKAGGNPLFLEEIVRMLVDSHRVVQRDDRWVATGEIDSLEVPDTIQGLLASRIDLLPSAVRHAGRIAAVIGRHFSTELFTEVFESREGTDGDPMEMLATLETHGLLKLEATSPQPEYGFRHALIHDVMYGGLLRRERHVLHGAVAKAIERLHADAVEDVAPLLGRHYAEAGETAKAVHHLFIAARRALALGARVESAGFFGHIQRLLETDPEAEAGDRIDAVIGRLQAGMGFTPGPESLNWIESVMPLAERLDDPDRLAALHERSVWTRSMQGETYSDPAFRAELDAGYALIPRLTDGATAALLEAMMGAAHRSGDEYAASVDPLKRAVDGLTAAERLAEASYNASMLADSLAQLGRFDEAEVAIDRADRLARKSGDMNAILDADLIRGSIAADRGELHEALELTKRGIAAAEEQGNTFCNMAGNFKLADQQLRLGEVTAAIGHLETSTGLAQYCNAGGYEALSRAWLAAARARTGDLRMGDFDAPLAAAVASGSRSTEGLVRLQRAIALAAAGLHKEAAGDFARSIELFGGYGGLPNLARAEHAYGQSLSAAGRPEAAAHLETAERLFNDLGIRSDGEPGG